MSIMENVDKEWNYNSLKQATTIINTGADNLTIEHNGFGDVTPVGEEASAVVNLEHIRGKESSENGYGQPKGLRSSAEDLLTVMSEMKATQSVTGSNIDHTTSQQPLLVPDQSHQNLTILQSASTDHSKPQINLSGELSATFNMKEPSDTEPLRVTQIGPDLQSKAKSTILPMQSSSDSHSLDRCDCVNSQVPTNHSLHSMTVSSSANDTESKIQVSSVKSLPIRDEMNDGVISQINHTVTVATNVVESPVIIYPPMQPQFGHTDSTNAIRMDPIEQSNVQSLSQTKSLPVDKQTHVESMSKTIDRNVLLEANAAHSLGVQSTAVAHGSGRNSEEAQTRPAKKPSPNNNNHRRLNETNDAKHAFDESLALARKPLTDMYGPFLCSSTDTCLNDARNRLHTALEQTWKLRKAFTDRVYNKYRVCLQPAPTTSQTIANIMSNPITHEQRLKEEIAMIRDEKELEKKEAAKLGSDVSALKDILPSIAAATADNAEQLMYFTAGLNLVILPEGQVSADLVSGYTDRGPVNTATGQRVRSISQAAAVAGECILDRTRKAIAMRHERSIRTYDTLTDIQSHHLTDLLAEYNNQLNTIASGITHNVSVHDMGQPKTLALLAGRKVELTSVPSVLPTQEDLSQKRPASSVVSTQTHVPPVKVPRTRHPALSLSMNYIMSLNPLNDEFKASDQKPSAASAWLLANCGSLGIAKTGHQRLRFTHTGSNVGMRRSSLTTNPMKGARSNLSPRLPSGSAINVGCHSLPSLPNVKDRKHRKQEVVVFSSDEVANEQFHSSMKALLGNFSKSEKDEWEISCSVMKIGVPRFLNSLINNVAKETEHAPSSNCITSDTSQGTRPSFPRRNVLMLSVLHALGAVTSSLEYKPIGSSKTLPPMKAEHAAIWSEKFNLVHGKLDLAEKESFGIWKPSYCASDVDCMRNEDLRRVDSGESFALSDNGGCKVSKKRKLSEPPPTQPINSPSLQPPLECDRSPPLRPSTTEHVVASSIQSKFADGMITATEFQTNKEDAVSSQAAHHLPMKASNLETSNETDISSVSISLVFPEVPAALSSIEANLIRHAKFHQAVSNMHDHTKLAAAVQYLMQLSSSIPGIHKLVVTALVERLNAPQFKNENRIVVPAMHRDVVAAAVTVFLLHKYETIITHSSSSNRCLGLIQVAVMCALYAFNSGNGVAPFVQSTKQSAEVAAAVCVGLNEELRLDRNLSFLIPNANDVMQLLDEARNMAFRKRAQERTLLLALLSRTIVLDEMVSMAFVGSMVRAGEAIGHGELFEIVQDEVSTASTMMPYDIFTDDTGGWEDPARPSEHITNGLSGDELVRQAHARSLIEMSLRKLQDRHHLQGGTDSYGPYVESSKNQMLQSTSERSVEKGQSPSPSPRPGLKRKSSVTEIAFPSGTGSAAARSLNVYDPKHYSAPLEWDSSSLRNRPYGLYAKELRKRSLSVGADDVKHLKRPRVDSFSTTPVFGSPSKSNANSSLLRSTHEVSWADVAEVFQGVKLVKRASHSTTKVTERNAPGAKKIYAPFFRRISIEELNEDNELEESDGDEDVTDEVILQRHQIILDKLKENLNRFTAARKQQQENRKKQQESRKSKDK